MNRSRRLRGERGAELVEFALVFPILLLVMMGIIDFGFAFQRYQVLVNAVREGARVGVLPGYADADIRARIVEYAAAAGLPNSASLTAATTITRPTIGPVGATFNAVAVTSNYPHTFSFLGPVATLFGGSFGTITLTASATMRVESP